MASWPCISLSYLPAATIASSFVVGASQPAIAQNQTARISSWRYNTDSERFEINSRGAIRPRLFVLDSPSRIVLDIPGSLWGKPEHQQTYSSGQIQQLRIGQLDPSTTRVVLQLKSSEPIDSTTLQLMTAEPERWAIQLPSAKPATATPTNSHSRHTPSLSPPNPIPSLSAPPAAIAPLSQTPASPPPPTPETTDSASDDLGVVQVLGVESSPDGFFIRTSGPVQVSTRRYFSPDRVGIDILNSSIATWEGPHAFNVDKFGVSTLRVGQNTPSTSRLVLDVVPSSGDWEATYDATQKGIRVFPAGSTDEASLAPDTPDRYTGPVATIRSVSLENSQLSIDADGFLFYRSGWDADSNAYRISVTPAQLPQEPETLPDPGLSADSPVDRIRFEQEAHLPNTVSILVQPAQGYTVNALSPDQGLKHIRLELAAIEAPTQGQGQVVAIDPGHGGRDPGALGVGGVREKDVVLSVSKRVSQLLDERGYTPVLTRSDDREILLQPRIDSAIAAGASILVSIHANALSRSDISGAETYYLRPDSARLATTLHHHLVSGTGAKDRKVRRARFFMVRETPTSLPSVLLETGYLTNPQEAQKLASPAHQEQLAQAIVAGIEDYFKATQ